MQRFVTQVLVWLVVVSLFAATPLMAISALTQSHEIAASGGPAVVTAASPSACDAFADGAMGRVEHVFFYHDKTEEEARDALQHAKPLSPFVEALPFVRSDAARQLLHSVSRGDRSASLVTRHLRL